MIDLLIPLREINHIASLTIKKYLIKLFLEFCNKLAVLGKYIKQGLSYLVKPIVKVCKFLFKFVILSIYKLYLFLKKKFQILYFPARSRVFSFFSKKYLIHFAVIIISCLVVVNSISAQEIREENFGEKTIIYAMYNDESFGDIEEIIDENSQTKVLSYLDKSNVSKKPTMVSGSQQEQISEEQLAESLTTITQGGAALVKPNITETKIAERPREGVVTYTIQAGDTLSSIAEQFSISTQTILWENNLSSRSLIKPGQTLQILPVSGISHKVKSGDTLIKLANKYNVEKEKIVEFNKLASASDISIGQTLIMPGGTQSVATTQYAKTSNVSIAPIRNLVTPPNSANIPTGKMVWPTSGRRITQYYSWRHHGLDIDGDHTSPLYAAEAGTITYVGWGGGYGNMVDINHGNGVKTRYGHLSKFFVKRGQNVAKGQTIGMMGTTGWSTGTHLHFEVIINGRKLNPLSYIK